jgi:phosphate transport system permease protein
MVWLHGGALATCLFMIVGLLGLVFYQGLNTFWPSPVIRVKTLGGATVLGEVTRQETYRPEASALDAIPEVARDEARAKLEQAGGASTRRLLRTGNHELTQTHYTWVNDFNTAEESRPEWALVVERATNDGRFYGFPKAFLLKGDVAATEPAEVLAKFHEYHHASVQRLAQRAKLKQKDRGTVNRKVEAARLAVRKAELKHGKESPQHRSAEEELESVKEWAADENARIDEEIADLDQENAKYQLKLETADGKEVVLPVADVVRLYPANQLGFFGKLRVYFSRWWEFLSADPRNANSEGGVFPALWGTAAMTLLMSLAVVPLGVMAALYLREYAKGGLIVSAVRIAVNNLAGVPSIVFGVFGLGFFCYFVGGGIDQAFFPEKLPNPTYGTGGILWASLTLALLTMPVVIVATEEALAAVPRSMREGSYACGASKWQTIRRIVLPRAMPGILTGTILAMARGAGEVAPLMLVGVQKLVADLPVDGVFPFVHPDRSFMHLGFHIYDVGFQSLDSESAKPMVYTTTMLLIVLITALNLGAMWIRSRLRKKYVSDAF